MTTFGIFHTAVSLIALASGAAALVRDKAITATDRGLASSVMTVA